MFIVALAIGWFVFFHQPKAPWSGALVPEDPQQTSDELPSPWTQGQNTFTPRARYQIRAVVLSKHSYWAGFTEDTIAPYDLALGWGPLSDAKVINALHITQGGRWYNYSWKGAPPVDPGLIVSHSANNHIIAADSRVLKQVEMIKRFDVVTLKGYLVDITRPDGWSWHTSLSRDDSGSGACELFWVEAVSF